MSIGHLYIFFGKVSIWVLCPLFKLDYLIFGVEFYKFWFIRFYLFIFRETGREEERGEKLQCVVTSRAPPTWDLTHNPGMCPDWG